MKAFNALYYRKMDAMTNAVYPLVIAMIKEGDERGLIDSLCLDGCSR